MSASMRRPYYREGGTGEGKVLGELAERGGGCLQGELVKPGMGKGGQYILFHQEVSSGKKSLVKSPRVLEKSSSTHTEGGEKFFGSDDQIFLTLEESFSDTKLLPLWTWGFLTWPNKAQKTKRGSFANGGKIGSHSGVLGEVYMQNTIRT